MEIGLDLKIIDRLSGGKLGTYDLPCPVCGPQRRKAANQRKPVLRIWRIESGFATYHCARCSERGYARDGSKARVVNQAVIARARAEATERERIASAERLSKARWLWSKRQPLSGSIAETYLCEARGYCGILPATLGFLPARGVHDAAMIAAFGLPSEPEFGCLEIANNDVCGIHITRLALDGSGKAGWENDKIMIGSSAGYPIVIAPPNDLLGQAIAEGIEDALSVHAATGLGAWAAGSASRLPALAGVLRAWIECTTVLADDGRLYVNSNDHDRHS